MTELKKASVKNKAEAVLFSVGHRISLDEISRLCRSRKEDIVLALQELKREYDEKLSSLMLIEEGDFWKFTVRDTYIPIVRKIVTETELTKSVLETLAVIAFKYPILQSDLIKIRTNKAYEHLLELEGAGYISRQKQGRTNLIKLTEKFFKYFDLTEEKLKDKFRDFESIAKAIKEKEEEVDMIKEEQRKKAEDLKKEDEKIKKEIESLDKSEEDYEVPLEAYKTKPAEIVSEDYAKEGNLIVEKEKIGELEVTEEKKEKVGKEVIGPKEEVYSQEHEQAKNVPEDLPHKKEEKSSIFAEKEMHSMKEKKKSKGIKLTPEMEKIVDQKVEKILGVQETKE